SCPTSPHTSGLLLLHDVRAAAARGSAATAISGAARRVVIVSTWRRGLAYASSVLVDGERRHPPQLEGRPSRRHAGSLPRHPDRERTATDGAANRGRKHDAFAVDAGRHLTGVRLDDDLIRRHDGEAGTLHPP